MPRLPGISHERAVRALQRAGFRIARQGKHVVLTIPRADPINAYTMAGIVKDAGLTIDQFRELL